MPRIMQNVYPRIESKLYLPQKCLVIVISCHRIQSIYITIISLQMENFMLKLITN